MAIFVNDLITQSGSQFELIAFDTSQTNELALTESAEALPAPTDKGWDKAHALKQQTGNFTEPNAQNAYRFENPAYDENLADLESFGEHPVCAQNNDFDPFWSFPKTPDNKPNKSIWHLGANFSELKPARDAVAPPLSTIVRIAHFDTGYDPDHRTFPSSLIRHDLEKNFIEGENPTSAIDIQSEGPTRQPGHGTGTLSILAGKPISLPDYHFDDSIGLARNIEIVPIRISRSVVLFRTGAFVQALNYVIGLYDNPATRCHIVTMSMGGLASQAWADAVNRAYDKGIFIVTAAGNNFGAVSPRTLVYPARFKRVVAACGVTFNLSPYFNPTAGLKVMQGNFGPRRDMDTAIAAFTPNVPWAKIGCGSTVSLAGAGTSSATPQVASAAALYRLRYFNEIEALPKGWMKVEAIRHALFQSAQKKIHPDYGASEIELYFGNGILKANAMLAIKPDASILEAAPRDVLFFPLLGLIAGNLNPFESMEAENIPIDDTTRVMYETEMVQLIQQSPALQALLDQEEKTPEDLSPAEREQFFRTILAMPEASETLKQFIQSQL